MPTKQKMHKERKSKRRKNFIKRYMKYLFPVLIYAVLYFFCISIGVLGSIPENTNYEVGGVAEEDIVATKDVVDEYSTGLLREEAQQKVLPVYDTDENIVQQVEEKIISTFSACGQVRQAARSRYLEIHPESAGMDLSGVDWESVLKDSMVQLMELTPEYITAQNIYTIAALEESELEALQESAVERTRAVLMEGLLADDVADAAEALRTEFVEDGRFQIGEASLAYNIVQNNLEPNRFYDKEATERAKEEAAQNVEEVVYKKGQNIVRSGEIISEAQYQLIKQLGLINAGTHNFNRWIAGTLFMTSLFLVGAIFAIATDRTLIEDQKTVMQVVTMLALSVIIALVCKRIDQRLCPVFIFSILGAVVLKQRTAVFFGIFASIITAFIMSPQDILFFDERVLRQVIAGVLGSIISVLLMDKKQKRSEYIVAGIAAGAVASLVYISYGILADYSFRDLAATVTYAIASGLVSGFMAVGILPIWETIFSVVTPSKLLELTDPSRPLLRKLMVEAPGTYHHSIMVANLAEAAAEAVGADALLTRVAAFYHDVGKLSDPLMFKENQINIPNPHDALTPKESALIIRQHVPDGVKMVSQNGLPQKAVDIISQHHGDSVVGYFYYMAKQQGEVEEKDFRYQGKKPQSKEAGILMMADITEAAIRAKKAASDADLRDQIEALIKEKYDEGQFDDCPITRKEIKQIIDAFTSIFEGARHERILYPQDRLQVNKEKQQA